MKFKSRFLFSALSIALSNIFVAPIADAVVTPPITQCHIEIDDPHFSNHIYRMTGIRAVKVNARSICNKPMRNLILSVEIHKVAILRDFLVASEKVSASYVGQNRSFKNEKTYVRCSSYKSSEYYGVAFAEADIEGRHLRTFHVTSEKTNKLNCGT
jgi:hypothetical protein